MKSVCGQWSVVSCLRKFVCVSMIFNFQFSIFNSALAQSSDYVLNRQQRTFLPNQVTSVSVDDSILYCYASGVMLQVQQSEGQLTGVQIDTALVKLDENINYVVRHPSTGDLYFTSLDKKGRSYLFCCHEEGNGKRNISQVRIAGGFLDKGMTVEHPTFTADGGMMVFSSFREDRNKGSLDLWYSRFNGKEWGDPVNLGHRINTTGDEINPFLYHGCLLFASNGNADDHGRYTLYATRLVTDRVGDTVGRGQIGRCLVQRLPAPFNAVGSDNFALSYDALTDCGFVISNRDNLTGRQLYTFSGTLEGLYLWGTVTDKFDHPLAGVTVAASQHGKPLCTTTSDESGHYGLYLHCGQQYELSYRLDNYFVNIEIMTAAQGEEGYLITENQHNVKLYGLPIGERFYYDDLFGPDADVELSARGREELVPFVQFLAENPGKQVSMSLINDLTDDPSFNSLLTDSRIRSLEKYFREALPSEVKISIDNGCNGMERCSNATGASILTVLIDN